LIERLMTYHWPGNVRELENAIESAVALSEAGQIDLSVLPSGIPSALASGGKTLPADESAPAAADVVNERAPLKTRVEAYERGLILAALAATHGNRSEAARALGIARGTLHEKLTKYGI
jgi:two-component system response regulator HydG